MADPELPLELAGLVSDSIFCRNTQLQQLYHLLGVRTPLLCRSKLTASKSRTWAPQSLVIHGVEATGKSLAVQSLLRILSEPSVIIRCRETVTTRHLLERTISSVKETLAEHPEAPIPPKTDGRCENIASFVAELHILLQAVDRFILVFDNVDQQREPAPTLLPALARLGEIVRLLHL